MDDQHLLETVRRLGGTITSTEAVRAGISWRDLYAHRDKGSLVELSRGVYRLADAQPTPYLDFLAVARRCLQCTICLTSALAYWDLTDEIPSRVHIAVPRDTWRPRIDYPPTRVYVFAADTFELGREHASTETGETFAVYSVTRSIVDALRLRNRVGPDLAYESLRRYLELPGSSPRELLVLAGKLRAKSIVARALEVLAG
ncbi:MAG: type IV toxin-antitoxin system AbiEi family antitoxin domain-containing protein [Chloroflexota bacterium]|nr:type IV toxin-antitoxin system AbiEi family antitoxin domain-containing protein [Chloroflexota bacterium]